MQDTCLPLCFYILILKTRILLWVNEMEKEKAQTFVFSEYQNKKGQKKQILISKSGVEVIRDDSKEN